VTLRVRLLGRVPYREALDLQRALQRARDDYVIVLEHPAEALLLYTLLLAVFFFVEGLFRIVAALAGHFRHWGWVLLNGVITLLLGVLIWRQWPLSGLYVVGLFLGINMVVEGATYINLALSARRLPV